MDVMSILDKLDTYLSECSRVPLVGKLMVDEEEVFALIDDLRAALPQELEQARWLIKERERMLQEARKEAEDIIKDAQGQIAAMASESVIAKEARAQAEEIMQKARDVAREINLGSRQYADEVMSKVENLLVELLETVRAGRKELAIDSSASAPPQPQTDAESADDDVRSVEFKPSAQPETDDDDEDEEREDRPSVKFRKRKGRN